MRDDIRPQQMIARRCSKDAWRASRAPAEGGRERFILAPGCSLPTYTYPPLIRAARAAVRG